jgi:ferredoxin
MNVAHRSRKLNENAAGGYYVGPVCAGCGLCLEIAPRHFSTDEVDGCSYVSRQPATAFEEASCKEAVEWCPVDAIGDDGLEMTPAADPARGRQLPVVQ